MVKIGREEPVASMDNGGKIIWAKHNEVQIVNIKSVGTAEVCLPTCSEFHLCACYQVLFSSTWKFLFSTM